MKSRKISLNESQKFYKMEYFWLLLMHNISLLDFLIICFHSVLFITIESHAQSQSNEQNEHDAK